ncbi:MULTISPECIES: YheT family hydrolase [unclassified Undibacterium]|uniref:YheT family hydrolase n=1 Tax=unclassified Undibacterium TaxID=2630295 RepID=UPI002AC8E256|nr:MULTISPECIES: alpha/beta fold hydrolase [unclassified Undibacterium]MEB0139371.1 alpha/beta fold hydrolase [Undibacterium sp. CCC2.1]MEB0173364.1 alpha/beta fold hydrolase [Undibacterium sp. CCC1.1]MEB0177249.1 alpha/beta fold hydrolase [Undibacterium sp. CCC3.4]MEB0216514.1 alpha/beta fold hydrolase [Undibacterium sp. 5I2]WPX44056.1 alpha/beta fold hydrolase [Undibacterium sp. CCC3.4]
MNYVSPRWLPGGHLQTIYPALGIAPPTPSLRRERWDTPDHDFIDVDFLDGQPGQPLVVLFHGLEGSSASHYARACMAALQARGWYGAVPHFRGCSGELNRAPRFYHSGDATEIDWIVRRLQAQHRAAHPHAALLLAGVSLGGNALLRWLGESQHAACIATAACAISAPLDLARGGAALSSGFNRIYTRMFLNTLKPKCLQKLEQFPGLFSRARMLAASNLYEFDNVVTAPLHGYRDTDDYWLRASACHILEQIRLPTLVLNAQNDPFLPGRYLPQTAAPCVQLEYPQHGGHVGFAAGSWPGNLAWLPAKMLHFFDQVL